MDLVFVCGKFGLREGGKDYAVMYPDFTEGLLSNIRFGFTSRSGRIGMVALFFKVVRTESILGLWKGVSPVSCLNNSVFCVLNLLE